MTEKDQNHSTNTLKVFLEILHTVKKRKNFQNNSYKKLTNSLKQALLKTSKYKR